MADRITPEQREAIVRKAVAERDALLNGRDAEAVAESCARAAYEAANPNGKRWSYLQPGEWERWRAVANAVRRVSDGLALHRPASNLLDVDSLGMHVVQFDTEADEIAALRAELARLARNAGVGGNDGR